MAQTPHHDPLADPDLERRFMDFLAAHPDLEDQLGMWMASAEVLEAQDPEAAAIFKATFPELAGR